MLLIKQGGGDYPTSTSQKEAFQWKTVLERTGILYFAVSFIEMRTSLYAVANQINFKLYWLYAAGNTIAKDV